MMSRRAIMTIIILLYSFCISFTLCAAMMIAGALANLEICPLWYIVLSLSLWLIFNFASFHSRKKSRRKGNHTHAHRKADH